MPDMSTWPRITSPDDPKRCQSNMAKSQCTFTKAPESEYCPMHGGTAGIRKAQAAQVGAFHLTRFKNRTKRMSEAEQKDLKGELSMLRSMLEMQWNSCTSQMELMLKSGPISNLVGQIQKLVETVQKIDVQSGVMLDKNQVIQLGQEVVGVISAHIQDTTVLEEIANDIADIVERLTTPAG